MMDIAGTLLAWLQRIAKMVDHLAGNLVIRLGDNAGATRLSLRDSDDVEVGYIDSDGNIWVKAAYNITRLSVFNSAGTMVGEIYNDQVETWQHIVTINAPAVVGEDSGIGIYATAGAGRISNVVLQALQTGSGKFANIILHADDTEAYVEIDNDVRLFGVMTIDPAIIAAPFTLGDKARGEKVAGLNADQVDGYDASKTPAASTIPVSDASGKLDGWVTANPSAANPSASVGLAAVNGSASTFMRSDAAPALDKSIFNNFSNIQASSLLSLTTSYQDVTGAAISFTSTYAEKVLILMTGGLNLPNGTAAAQVGDRIDFGLVVDGTMDSTLNRITMPGVSSGVSMAAGALRATQPYIYNLSSGSHTIKLQAKNNDGARGQVSVASGLLVWRLPS